MCVMIELKIYSLNNFEVYNTILLIIVIMLCIGASQLALVVKKLPANVADMRHGFNLWVRKIPWRRKWQPTPVFLPGKSNGQRSLAGYSPWGCKESDMIKTT